MMKDLLPANPNLDMMMEPEAIDHTGHAVKHMDGEVGGLRFNKKRNTSNMVAVRMPSLLPEAAMTGMVGRNAGEIIESKVFSKSKHSSGAKIVEAAQEIVRGKPLLFLILDRVICQPPFQKKGDRVMVVHPSIAEMRPESEQELKQEHERRCEHA